MSTYTGLKEYVAANLETKSMRELYDEARTKFGYASSLRSFGKYVSKIRSGTLKLSPRNAVEAALPNESTESKLLRILSKKEPSDILDICNELEILPKDLHEHLEKLRTQGYELIHNQYHVGLAKNTTADVEPMTKCIGDPDEYEVRFGVASDLHFGSKACQLTALHQFVEECKAQDIHDILVPGDVFAGYNVYPGQVLDQYAIGSEAQESSAIINLPSGVNWYMIGGNHDYSFIKKAGHNPLAVLANNRDDVHYLGYDNVTVPLLPGIEAVLWHPDGGTGYARSYKLQKYIDNIMGGELMSIGNNSKESPSIKFILAGHLHVQMQMMHGNSIMGMQCGAFEGLTNYIARKGYLPDIGGYIIKAKFDKETKMFAEHEVTWKAYREIAHDYRNFRHTLMEHKVKQPLLRERKLHQLEKLYFFE